MQRDKGEKRGQPPFDNSLAPTAPINTRRTCATITVPPSILLRADVVKAMSVPGQKSPSAGVPRHARCWGKAEANPLKADIIFDMSPVEGTTEVDFCGPDSRS
jgi:hypothetical protein